MQLDVGRFWFVLMIGVGMGAGVSISVAQQPGPDVQMRIVLEQQTGSTFRTVSPQHVFRTGDKIRFRVSSSADGFLYVSNRAASGKYSQLFPVKGADNRLEHGRDYSIPAASRSWFRIEEPPGYETIFFTFAHSPLGRNPDSGPVSPTDTKTGTNGRPMPISKAPELIPRCDDAVFRARGECLDVSAGPSAVAPGAPGDPGTLTPRDVTIEPGPDGAVVTPVTPGDAPIVYEFRIAHR